VLDFPKTTQTDTRLTLKSWFNLVQFADAKPSPGDPPVTLDPKLMAKAAWYAAVS
jgi:hypothetical protein